MKRTYIYSISLAAALALGGSLAASAQTMAQNPGAMAGPQGTAPGMMGGQGGMGGMGGGMGQGMQGQMMRMMQMMKAMHAQGGMMGGAMMGGASPMAGLIKSFDTDGDGTVSAQEMQAGLAAKLAEYDANGDATLSIDEFETLHSALIREKMVDRFQALDADGDGQVTEQELTAAAERMKGAMGGGMMGGGMMGGMGAMMGGMGQGGMGQGGMGQGMQGQGGMGQGNGAMMQDQDKDN